MGKKVSMLDIAQRLGISKNTVSLALRGMPGINEQTRQLIISTANELGYSYTRNNDSSKNICLILSKSTRNSVGFFNYVQFGMEAEAKKQGLNVIIYYYDESIENFEVPLCIKDGMISGIITLGRVSRKTANTILGFDLPVVMVDHYFDNINIDYILTDNISSGYVATEYLIKNGHTKIGFIGNIHASISFSDRYQGYLRALSHYNIPVVSDFIIHKSMEDLAASSPSLLVQELQSLKNMPDAIFCCNDSEAITVNKAFYELGIKVPEDISIIGFDDIEFSRSMSPELTTMRVEKEIMGKKAVEKLVKIMDDDLVMPEKLLLSTSLIERKSVTTIKDVY
jgi:LacI family transcriptional regulator